MLVVCGNEEEFEIIEEDREEETVDENAIEVRAVEYLNIRLSINLVVGLTNPGTMKVKGKVKNEEVVVLIDCGATHNFIFEKLVTNLNLLLKATTNYGVIMGLGATVKGKGIYEKVEVMLGEWKVVGSFLPLGLEGVGVILDVFEWPETLPSKKGIKHHIHLKQGTNLVNVRSYHYAHQQKEKIERLADEMLASRIIRPSTSPNSSPVLLARKKDGSWRFCVDYQTLNNVTVLDKFPIHVIEELFNELSGANMFSKIDLKVALMIAVFRSYMRKFVLVFFDDILCNFAKERVGYLGHVIYEKRVEVDLEKIRAIRKWPAPTNVREVRGFLGLTGYYRRFVQNYGSIVGPLTQLSKDGSFKWNEEANVSFEKLKTTMMTLPVLAMSNFNLPFEIETNASGYDRWRPYLLGRKFIVKIDQRSLKFLLECVIQPQYQKWIAKLLGYSFEVVYKPGLENKAADALSRVPPTVHLNHILAPGLIDLVKIQEEVENDPKLKVKSIVGQEPEEIPNFTVHRGVLQFKGRKLLDYMATQDPLYQTRIGRVEAYLRCFSGKRPKEWTNWLHWAEYWYNTTYNSSIGITPFQAVYGRLPPPLLYYGDMKTPNSTLDQQLKDRDIALGTLKEHLRITQKKMKKQADLKRRAIEFQVVDMVFLKLRSNRQVSLRMKRNEKLYLKYFGPYKVLEKIGSVAYKLELLSTTTIHPVFHISQLKKTLGDHTQVQQLESYLSENHEWMTQLEEVYG
ncbi:ty3-gypsy retroelement transposase [Cucumis melo var. makuwa]|uniref:Ty3-gypsy retroelement transposase n=1 Tax=Cucumis melo var. makuwa TaxID=1194695 RepID=A0A5D3BPJ9_CUCMM|nr:ty3-gypsy retroelement transposase [Cucumis melo var. makuwa]